MAFIGLHEAIVALLSINGRSGTPDINSGLRVLIWSGGSIKIAEAIAEINEIRAKQVGMEMGLSIMVPIPQNRKIVCEN